jgi:hypothetical protein
MAYKNIEDRRAYARKYFLLKIKPDPVKYKKHQSYGKSERARLYMLDYQRKARIKIRSDPVTWEQYKARVREANRKFRNKPKNMIKIERGKLENQYTRMLKYELNSPEMRQNKAKIFSILGNKCSKCSTSHQLVLIHNDGKEYKVRRQNRMYYTKFYRFYAIRPEEVKSRLALICLECKLGIYLSTKTFK